MSVEVGQSSRVGDGARGSGSGVSSGLIVLFALAVGVGVANLYYVQPLLPLVRRSFHIAPGVAALSVTLVQIGYVLGLAFVLPLGDLIERRRLVVALSISGAAALLFASVAPSFVALLVAMALIGVASVVVHLLVPYAATLAKDAERGRVIGQVMSGLMLGILLARTFSGLVAGASNWRVVFIVAAGAMLLIALLLRKRLPPWKSPVELSYGQLLVSLVDLVRTEPLLVRRGMYGIASMGAFSVTWTSIAFVLAGAPYHYNSATIGLFGLVGAAGVAMANVAGRLTDKEKAAQLTVFNSACIALSFVAMAVGAHSLVALILGIVVLDIGCQGMQITNQHQIFTLRPDARTRLNAVYMVMFFIGATGGSVLSAAVYDSFGWHGNCIAGAAIGAGSLVASLVGLGRKAQPPATAGTIESV